MLNLIIIRHGPTSWNAQKRIQGTTDIPLSDQGLKQVANWRLPDRFASYQWISSPLQRAMQTARLLGGNPIQAPDLAEMNWGQWEGRRLEDLRQKDPLGVANNLAKGLDFRPSDGESPRDVQKRLLNWFKDLQRPTIAVCHKGVLQAAYALASGWQMVEERPHKLRDGHAHSFWLQEQVLTIDELNIPLVPPKEVP